MFLLHLNTLVRLKLCLMIGIYALINKTLYYIPINDTTFKLSVFWPYDTESRINKLRFKFSDSVSLSFKTRLTLVTCFLWRRYIKYISSMEPETENMMK